MSFEILAPLLFFQSNQSVLMHQKAKNWWEWNGIQVIVNPLPFNEAIYPETSVQHIEICCRNENESAQRFQLRFRVITNFVFSRYLIPGVSINGNHWGRGKEPKGLMQDCQPWIFDCRSTTIPACTVSENDQRFLALFASDKKTASLNVSCGMMETDDGKMIHFLHYPSAESPYTYIDRDEYGSSHEDRIVLQPDEEFHVSCYLADGIVRQCGYAAAQVEDIALDLLGHSQAPRFTPSEVIQLCASFAKRIQFTDEDRQALFSIGLSLNEKKQWQLNPGIEFGWCGQNGLYALLFIRRGLQEKNYEFLPLGIKNLDTWVKATGRTGLIHTHLDRWQKDLSNTEDVCNLAFAIAIFTLAWRLLLDHGINKRQWLDTARGAASFLCTHFTEEAGFGKAWDVETGEMEDRNGTIGAYMIPALCILYRETGQSEWLSMARRACRFYVKRDLDQFMCCAGALDTYCIDKETSSGLLIGALMLYDIDNADEWLTAAKKAGWYFCSWMFHYDIPYEKNTDFYKYGYHTLGGTSVSVQHWHIDPWGALVVPEIMKLYDLTGDAHWKKRANLLWQSAIQNITPEEGRSVHGVCRPRGSQNEGYLHCRWGKQAPGTFNDWLVAWPQAFIWRAALDTNWTNGKDQGP